MIALLATLVLAASPDPFAGCTIKEPRPGDRDINCPGLVASVAHGPPGMAADALLAAAIDGVRAGFKGELKTDPATLALGKERLEGLRYVALHPKDRAPVLVGRLFPTKDPADPARVRLIGCGASVQHTSGEKSCDAILANLARGSPDASKP